MIGIITLAVSDFLLPCILVGLVCLGIGCGAGIIIIKQINKKKGIDAEKIIEDAKKTAEDNRKKSIIETKQELYKLKQDSDKEIKQNFKKLFNNCSR